MVSTGLIARSAPGKRKLRADTAVNC